MTSADWAQLPEQIFLAYAHDEESAAQAASLVELLGDLEPRLEIRRSTLDLSAKSLEAILRVLENTTVPSMGELYESIIEQRIAQWLHDLTPQTPEQVERVRQGAIEIQQDPKYQNTIQRLVSGIRREDIAELSKWGLLILAAAILFRVSDWPVTRHLSAAQDAALQNWLITVSIIVVIAIALSQGKRDK